MNDTARLGLEFGQHVQKVTQELLLAGSPRSLSEMERGIRQALLRIGRFLLEAWLALQEGIYMALTIPCRCGGTAAYEGKREGTLFTLLGSVRYKRGYYLCPHCHRGTCPLDERLGLRPGELSAELEGLTAMTGAQVAFEKGSDLFERLTLVGISPQSMDKATQAMGEEVMRVEEEWRAASQDMKALDAQEREGKDARRLYGTLDATKVHTRAQRSEDDEGWRDLKVGAWFLTDARPPATPEAEWDVRAREVTYFCDLAEAKAFGPLLWATGFQRQALRAQEIVFLGDGAEWIWNLVTDYFPQAIQIVDWFHAAEHLALMAKAAFPDEGQRKTWLHPVRNALWEGQIEEVIQASVALVAAGKGVEEAQKGITYFTNNRHRMHYATYRAQGYQIGSGTVESGCKQIGIQRMKVPGATWSLEGARHTAKARAALLSGQWDYLTARREHLPHAP